MATEHEPTCPACGSRMVPIVYGYPAWEMVEAEQRGEVVLGGCMVGPGMPRFACSACGTTAEEPPAATRLR